MYVGTCVVIMRCKRRLALMKINAYREFARKFINADKKFQLAQLCEKPQLSHSFCCIDHCGFGKRRHPQQQFGAKLLDQPMSSPTAYVSSALSLSLSLSVLTQLPKQRLRLEGIRSAPAEMMDSRDSHRMVGSSALGMMQQPPGNA